MPTKYRFVTDGDFVKFYDDAQLVLTADKSSNVLTWVYDSTPGISFDIDGYGYHTDDMADISFDDVVVTSQADFVTKAQAMFPNLQVGGSAESPGIDDVLAESQAITANREIFASGFDLTLVVTKLKISDGDIEGSKENFIITGTGDSMEFICTDIKLSPVNRLLITNTLEFADNAAALSGGVPNNGLYFTIVSGEKILKLAHDD